MDTSDTFDTEYAASALVDPVKVSCVEEVCVGLSQFCRVAR